LSKYIEVFNIKLNIEYLIYLKYIKYHEEGPCLKTDRQFMCTTISFLKAQSGIASQITTINH